MANDTINNGIKKAAGDTNSVNYKNYTYEGYGPNGIAIIVETLTDNANRTAANVRSAFTKGNGSIGAQGCVSFMFDRKGQIIIDKEECDTDPDELMMMALDAGADDFNEEDDSFEILTDPDSCETVVHERRLCDVHDLHDPALVVLVLSFRRVADGRGLRADLFELLLHNGGRQRGDAKLYRHGGRGHEADGIRGLGEPLRPQHGRGRKHTRLRQGLFAGGGRL